MNKYIANLKKYKWAILEITLAVVVAITGFLNDDPTYALHSIILSLLAFSSLQDVRIKDLEAQIK